MVCYLRQLIEFFCCCRFLHEVASIRCLQQAISQSWFESTSRSLTPHKA
jgi:hypothetical protein